MHTQPRNGRHGLEELALPPLQTGHVSDMEDSTEFSGEDAPPLVSDGIAPDLISAHV
jgi:hypothetical protein